jgi:hypothetical protein
VVDSLAFVSDWGKGFRILDISTLQNPVEIGYVNINDSGASATYDAFIVGQLAYLARSSDLRIIDILDPEDPKEIGSCNAGGGDVFVLGSYAYVAAGENGLHIVDVSDSTNPFEVGCFDTIGQACAVHVVGTYAFVAYGDHDFYVVDVSIPTDPIGIIQCPLPDAEGKDVFVSGSLAYVAGGAGGLQIVNIANPTAPYKIGSCNTPGYSIAVHVSLPYVYVADELEGLQVIDVSTPTNPQIVGYYDTPKEAQCVFASGPYCFVAARGAGIQIYENLFLDVNEKKSKKRYKVFSLMENPVIGNDIHIVLNLPNPETVNFKLYNILGQRIRDFNCEQLSAGRHNLHLEVGKIPNGIYFLRMTDSKQRKTEKVAIIR